MTLDLLPKVAVPPSSAVCHWRARLLYNLATTPYQQKSRRLMLAGNGLQEGDFRLSPPTAGAEFSRFQGAPPGQGWHVRLDTVGRKPYKTPGA